MIKNKDKLSDENLIKKIKNEYSNEAMEEIINRHQNLYYSTVHRYHKKNPQSNLAELLEDLYIVFNNSVEKYNCKRKAKFSTFLSHMTYWHCLNINKEAGKTLNFEHSDIDKINQSNNRVFNFKNNIEDINNYLLNILGQLNDSRVIHIFKLRYLEGHNKKSSNMPWNQVAKRLKEITGKTLSISGLINIDIRTKRFLADKLKSSNLIDKI